MKDVICTIITGDYAHYALALHDSILKFNREADYAVFVSKDSIPALLFEEFEQRGILLFTVENFNNNQTATLLQDKYSENNHDGYRWGMKPVFINELLKVGFERVIYLDCDIFIFNDFNFLFDKLKDCNILLSPHWRCSNPEINLTNFRHNFLDGIYNGGFIGASKGGEAALIYWANLCLFNCEVNRNEGYYVDQRYLDILPTRFDGVAHITHKGCNVANWNIVDCKRILQSNGEVLINDEFPIVFIHFTNSLFKGAYLWKDDTLLIPLIEKYRDTVLKYYDKDIIADFYANKINLTSRTEEGKEIGASNKFKVLKKIYKKVIKKS